MRCPVCRAENADGPDCRRCRADLSMLFTLEAQREQLLAKAHNAVRNGGWYEVEQLANRASALRKGDDAHRLLAVACLMRRDFSRAWQYYQKVSNK